MAVDTVTETVREIAMMVTDAQETKDVQEKTIRERDLMRVMVTTRILVRFEDTKALAWFVVGLSSIQPFIPFINRGKRFFDAFRQGSIAPLLAFYNDFIYLISIHHSW